MDRRVKRTRRLLRSALLELIEIKSFEDLTIQEITDYAELSRATFYLHFRDKHELLTECLTELFDELSQHYSPFSLDTENATFPPSHYLFQHIADHHKLYTALLGQSCVADVIYGILDYTSDKIELEIQHILDQNHLQSKVPLAIIARQIAGAEFNLIVWWLSNDIPHDVAYMSNQAHQLSVLAVCHALSIPLDSLPPGLL
ncbi:TetR/AcrR family transcriptional regulator [Anaerolineales bacterium]